MDRWAALPSSCESAKEVTACTRVAPPAARTSLPQQFPVPLADHFVQKELGRARQHEAGQAVDEQQAQTDRQAPFSRRDEIPGVLDDDREWGGLFLVLLRRSASACAAPFPGGHPSGQNPEFGHGQQTRENRGKRILLEMIVRSAIETTCHCQTIAPDGERIPAFTY